MPNGRVVSDDVMERAHARLVLCRDLTDEAQADCQVISDLLAALRAARKDTERLEWLQKHGDDLTTDYETDSEGAARVNFSTYYGESGYDLRSVIDAAIAEESDVHS